MIVGNVIGSTFKGFDRRDCRGIFARKVNSVPLGILFWAFSWGSFSLLLVALKQHGYYFEIILPGSLVGIDCGMATQKYGAGYKTKQA